MVKKTLLFLIFTSAVFLVAGEFTASVNNTQVSLNESFSLDLTLKEASPKEGPTLFDLKKDFLIHSQQQVTNLALVNGKVSSNITWKFCLTPRKEGVIQVPSIPIDTDEGILSTQPITLNVIKGSILPSIGENTEMNITTKISNTSPYKNEPLIYTASLSSKMPLYNVQQQKMQMENAIVELIEPPKLEQKVIEGVLLNVVEFSYLITPLKVGSLTIPPLAIQGAIPQKRRGPFDLPHNDDLDPFVIMQGLQRLKSFTSMTEEIQLDVQPPLSEVSPWLSAKAFRLEEQWPSDQILRAKEPFSRGFLIQAEGLKESQLPHLEDLQNLSSTFKVYADKPEGEEKIFQGVLHSMRKERYTLIPQQAGTWVLPEISISWWDSTKKEKKSSTIPARTVQILPALATTTSVAEEERGPSLPTTAAAEAPIASLHPPLLLYSIMGILTFCLMGALLWGFSLQRKIGKPPTQKLMKPPAIHPKKAVLPPVMAAQKEKKEKLPDLNPT